MALLTRVDLRGRTLDSSAAVAKVLPRPQTVAEPPTAAVAAIIDDVRKRGDDALRDLTLRFDRVDIQDFRVPRENLQAALRELDPDLRRALEVAKGEIEAFQVDARPVDRVMDRDGRFVRQMWLPVASAGCYVPGGLAQYPSTVLMTGVTARAAGVSRVVLTSAPDQSGEIPSVVRAAAALVDAEVYRVGGVQAVAAMAYGTATIAPVDLVVGPGNMYVAEALRQVSGAVGTPSAIAGPSEVVVIADDSTSPMYVASDLVKQIEHGPGGSAYAITWSEEMASRIETELDRLLVGVPESDQIRKTFAEGGWLVLVDGPDQATDIVNGIAPEHVEVLFDGDVADRIVDGVRHAGAILVGANGSAAISDYLGPNHVLPTGGSARFGWELGVADFMRPVTVQRLTDAAFSRLGPTVQTIAKAEGLPWHGASVTARLETMAVPSR